MHLDELVEDRVGLGAVALEGDVERRGRGLDEEPARLESTGPLIGAVTGLEYPSVSRMVEPGARLLIFSDGAFEILQI